MELTYYFLLGLHVGGGMTALIAGLIAILVKKGLRSHQLAGRAFSWGMVIANVAATFICLMKWNEFLLHIAIFTGFQLTMGWRAVLRKNRPGNAVDVVMIFIGLANGAIMVLSGNIVLIVFGGIQLLLAVQEGWMWYRQWKGIKPEPKQWLLRHIGMMLGAYIATSTAFLVVNVNGFEPAWLPWLTPTMIGVPLIVYWSRKFGKAKVVR